MKFRFFNPSAEVKVSRRNLPHWEQEDAYYFITWRTADSIPTEVLESLNGERNEWLLAHRIDPHQEDWQRDVELLPCDQYREFYQRFTVRWHDALDAGHGDCVLRQPALRELVVSSLLHFNGQRHELEAYVVMPNNVHVLAGIAGRAEMKKLCRSWKHFTAVQINQHRGRGGKFWQWESFDHLVRSPASLVKFRQYIGTNPVKARLNTGDYSAWIKQPGC